jgi:flagellar hook-associated protein 3 FlgL
MLASVHGSTDKYLADLDRLQASMDRAQRQLSSGRRVERPSDDPSAVPVILQTLGEISANEQAQKNLELAANELSVTDSALQTAIRLIERAVVVATQGATMTLPSEERIALANEVNSLLESLVSTSQTAVNGRYVFSGDRDGQAMYQLDASAPDGVSQVMTASATRAVRDDSGALISVERTAQEIFDVRQTDGAPGSGNAFAALAALSRALAADDPDAVKAAGAALELAGDHVNQQISFYGTAQNRVNNAINHAKTFLLHHKDDLATARDADLAAATLEMSQASIQQEAALAARAKASQRNLFDYLG